VRRSNLLVVAGVAFFVVGVVIVALLQRDNSNNGSSSGGQTVDVLFAKEEIPQGTAGKDAIAKVETRRIRASDKRADALAAPSELTNSVFTATFTKGEQIRSSGLRQLSQVPTIAVPEGKEEVAVQVPFEAGGACYIAPGDLVNVYQVFPTAIANVVGTPHTQLLLTKVKVLDISCQQAPLSGATTVAATPTTQATGPVTRNAATSQVTVLLAVDSIDAEKIIFGSHSADSFLYLTRVDANAAPSGPTPGRGFDNIFDESPEVANARDH